MQMIDTWIQSAPLWQAAWVVALVWLLWGALHSLLAATRVRTGSGVAPVPWRRAYNVIALVTLSVPVVLMLRANVGSPMLLSYSSWAGLLPWVARAIAIGLFLSTLTSYSAAQFLGLRAESDSPDLGFSMAHRFVRHPWYFCILILLWVRPLSVVDVSTSVALTLYVLIGTMLEERKLRTQFGDMWLSYAAQVPMLLPSVRRRLSAAQLRFLLSRRE